jgi:hypothetical protein
LTDGFEISDTAITIAAGFAFASFAVKKAEINITIKKASMSIAALTQD